MARIILATEGQKLIKVECPKIASGDKNVDYLRVEFCPSWDGFAKTAVFYRNESEVYYAVMDNNNECVIPWEVLQSEGFLYLGVFGSKDNTRKTSEVISYKIDKGAIVDDIKPSDPTPDIYDQILAKLTLEGIGAAPAGYGLGKNSYNVTGTSFSDKEKLAAISGNSFFAYRNPNDALVSGDSGTVYVYGIHYQYTGNFAKQIAVTVYNGSVIERVKVDAVWGEWEYAKCNYVLNREYRTTERYQSKPVYTKLVSCGAVASGEKSVNITTNATALIRYSGSYVDSDGMLRAVPWLNPTNHPTHFINIGVKKDSVLIYGGSAYSTGFGTLYLQIWYTKD